MTSVQNARMSLTVSEPAVDFSDSVLQELTLSEGLSRPYAGKLVLTRPRVLSGDELEALLRAAFHLTLEVSVDELPTTRALCGCILGCRYLGRIERGVFQYELNLGCPLQKLTAARHCRSFSQKSVPDVLGEILQPLAHELEVRTDFAGPAGRQELIAAAYFDEYEIFSQSAESDFDFWRKLMLMYGINYSFVHPQDPGSFKPVLYLSRGLTVRAGTSCTLGAGAESFTGADCGNLDNLCRGALYGSTPAQLDEARLSALGSAVQNDFLKGHFLTLNTLEAHYQSAAPEGGAADGAESFFAGAANQYGYCEGAERERLRQNFAARRITSGTDVYVGSTPELFLEPGTVMEIYDLFGPPDTGAAAQRLTLFCLNTRLRIVLPSPGQAGGSGAELSLEFEARDFHHGSEAMLNPGSLDLLPSLLFSEDAIACERTLYALASGDPEGPGEPERPGKTLLEAVVCTADGKVEHDGNSAPYATDVPQAPTMFYALPAAVLKSEPGDRDRAACVLVVRCTSAGENANDERAMQLPEVGQKVLLMIAQGQYYLHSFLPELIEERQDPGVPGQENWRLQHWGTSYTAGNGQRCGAGISIEQHGQSRADIENMLLCAYLTGGLEAIKQQQVQRTNNTQVENGYNPVVQAELDTKWARIATAFATLGEERRNYVDTRVRDFAGRFADGINEGSSGEDVAGARASYEAAISACENAISDFREALSTMADNLLLTEDLDNASFDGETVQSRRPLLFVAATNGGSDSSPAEPTISEDEQEIVLRIDSSGSIVIEANGDLDLEGQDISLTATSEISANADVVDGAADVQYKMTGDRSSLTADFAALGLSSRMWPAYEQMSRFFGSSLSVDGQRGVVGMGPNVTLSALLRASMSDIAGGVVTDTMGHILMGGYHITASTNDAVSATINLTELVGRVCIICADVSRCFKDADDPAKKIRIRNGYTSMMDTLDIVRQIGTSIAKIVNSHAHGAKLWLTIVTMVLNVICDILDAVMVGLRNQASKAEDDDKRHSLQNSSDGMCYALTAVKFVSMLTVEAAAIAAAGIPGLVAASFTLIEGSTFVNSAEFHGADAVQTDARSPAAAVNNGDIAGVADD